MSKVKRSKELDPHLKKEIKNIENILAKFIVGNENKITYYTGNLRKDVLDNFTLKQSNNIFSKLDKFRGCLHLFQKKLPSFIDPEGVEWIGYDYIAVKK